MASGTTRSRLGPRLFDPFIFARCLRKRERGVVVVTDPDAEAKET